jgi:hypothetical protein
MTIKIGKKLTEEDKLIQEFDLINPFARDLAPGGERDRDFEPIDPGWPYPDSNRRPKYFILPLDLNI